MKTCPFCNEEIQDKAIKCRYCLKFLDSTEIKKDDTNKNIKSTVPILNTLSTGEAASEGCLAGGCMGSFCICFGILLSAFGITAIIGIPLIILGVATMVGGPLTGGYYKKSLIGDCPFCEFKINVPISENNTRCPRCKKLIVIKDNKFVGID